MTPDEYDAQYPETGSSNITKATPEWREILAQARENHHGYVLHAAYALVNEQVMSGIAWSKCTNCGCPYRMDSEGATDAGCSPDCHEDYSLYVFGTLDT